MSARAWLLAWGVAAAACQSLTPPHSDGGGGSGGTAGGGSGAAGGGGAGGGGTAGGGGSGGSGGSGGTGGTGGGTAGGGAPSFSFGTVQLPSVATSGVVAAIGTDATETWVATTNGVLFESTSGAAFSQVAIAARSTYALYVAPDGALFLGQAGAATRCPANCAASPSFTSDLYPNSQFTAVCGSASNDVYFVGSDGQSNGFLVHWNGSALSTVAASLGVTFPSACWLSPSGVLYVGAKQDLVRFEGGQVFTESLDLTALGTGASALYWYGVAGAGTEVFAGGTRATMARRTGVGTWALVTPLPSASGDLHAAVGLTGNEAYAGGFDAAGAVFWAWDGSTWSKTSTPLAGMVYVHAMAARGTNELYLGGADSLTHPLLLRAQR